MPGFGGCERAHSSLEYCLKESTHLSYLPNVCRLRNRLFCASCTVVKPVVPVISLWGGEQDRCMSSQ